MLRALQQQVNIKSNRRTMDIIRELTEIATPDPDYINASFIEVKCLLTHKLLFFACKVKSRRSEKVSNTIIKLLAYSSHTYIDRGNHFQMKKM